MILYPHAKINVGLAITGVRPDGYHTIQSIFLPIGLSDILEVMQAEAKQTQSFQVTGIPVDSEGGKNLVIRALEFIRRDHDIPPVHIHLHKCIPPGSGLGGGSSDAVAMMLALDQLFKLELDKDRQKEYARALGSDCTFFLDNSPCLVGGVGDEVEAVKLSQVSGYWLVLVVPEIRISTSWAYAMVQPRPEVAAVSEWAGAPVKSWKKWIKNDFELPVFKAYPMLEDIKSGLYQLGAEYASLSGSGSSVYGLFPELPDVRGQFSGALVWVEQFRY